MRRTRRAKLPTNPTSLNDFDALPEDFQCTLADEKFLIFDSGRPAEEEEEEDEKEESRVIVFGTQRNLQILKKSRVWFLDGTFKVKNLLFFFMKRLDH